MDWGFRGRSPSRLLIACIAVLVQLNVFFHLELHQRVLSNDILKDAAAVRTAWAQGEQPQFPRPFCPVCQVVRNGAVQPGAEQHGVMHLELMATVLPAEPSSVSLVSLLQPSGRDPPRG